MVSIIITVWASLGVFSGIALAIMTRSYPTLSLLVGFILGPILVVSWIIESIKKRGAKAPR